MNLKNCGRVYYIRCFQLYSEPSIWIRLTLLYYLYILVLLDSFMFYVNFFRINGKDSLFFEKLLGQVENALIVALCFLP